MLQHLVKCIQVNLTNTPSLTHKHNIELMNSKGDMCTFIE